MSDITKCLLIFIVLVHHAHADRPKPKDYEEPQPGGKSFFFLGGLIRRIKSRWQNQNLPPSPYGSGPIFTGYYGCAFCRPPQYQVVQPVQEIHTVQAVQPLPPIQPIVVQQAQVYPPNGYAQAIAQPNPVYPPVQPQPIPQQLQYPGTYGSPQPSYGTAQPYQPYPAYPAAYTSPVPGQIYQSAGCAYPGYLCGRKS